MGIGRGSEGSSSDIDRLLRLLQGGAVMSGSVHGQDGVPKRITGKYGKSGITNTKPAHTGSRDKLDQMQDLFLMHFDKTTKHLTRAEHLILARQLASSFETMANNGA